MCDQDGQVEMNKRNRVRYGHGHIDNGAILCYSDLDLTLVNEAI